MRKRTTIILLSVLTGLPGLAGCAGDDPAATSTSSPSVTSQTASATPTRTAPPEASGNGIAEMEPLEILEQTKKATTAVTSVRMRGQMRDDGEWLNVDMRFKGKKASAGSLEIGEQRVDLIVIGSVVYLKGNKAFWVDADGEATARGFAGKYVKASTTDKPIANLVAMTSFQEMLAAIPKPDDFTNATKGASATINDLAAIPVRLPGYTDMYVATEGKPYLLRLSYTEKEEHVDFLEHDKPVAIEPPPDRLVIDLAEFG